MTERLFENESSSIIETRAMHDDIRQRTNAK